MPQPYAAIFFDMDGTLFDLIACERETLRRLLAEAAPAISPATGEAFLTAYAAISPSHWAAGLAGDASRESIVNGILAAVCTQPGMNVFPQTRLAERYWRLFADVAVLEAGAQELLAALSSHSTRYRLGVISNGYADTQRPRLAAAGLTDYFETIVVSGELGWAKPDARIFAHALAALDVPPATALYVGDSLSHDLAGALGAGLDFCLYRPKGSEGLDLPAGVTVVTALSQLAAILG